MKKKLVIFIYSLASGGAERVVSILLYKLQKNYTITLVLMNKTIFYSIPKGIKVLYLEKSFAKENFIYKILKLPFLAWKYKQLCKVHHIEISLSFLVRPNYINVLSKLLGNKSRCIISERSFLSEEFKEQKIHFYIRKKLITYLYNKSDFIVAISKGTKNDLISVYRIQKEKVKVIYNPIDLVSVLKLSCEANINKDINYFTFITVGRLDQGKNHQLLINAMSKIEKENIKLIIIGDGEELKNLKTLVTKLNIESKIFFLGLQKNPFIYLKESDCFVFSTSYESFGNVLIEALACELPIISTDCKSGPREILAPSSNIEFKLKDRIALEEYGILTPVGDVDKMAEAMKLIIKYKKIRDKYRKKSLYRVKDFDLDKIIYEWNKILK